MVVIFARHVASRLLTGLWTSLQLAVTKWYLVSWLATLYNKLPRAAVSSTCRVAMTPNASADLRLYLVKLDGWACTPRTVQMYIYLYVQQWTTTLQV
jgi:hypothetical protein